MPEILYALDPTLTPEAFRDLLVASTLAPRRPTHDLARLDRMLRNADLIVTARLDDQARTLVGIARSVTDFAFCCYLSDLAVSLNHQCRGIGHALIDHTRQHVGPEVSVILTSAPAAVGFYETIGMPRVPDAFRYRNER